MLYNVDVMIEADRIDKRQNSHECLICGELVTVG